MLNDQLPDYWYEISKHDTETAYLLIREKGYPDIIIYNTAIHPQAFKPGDEW